MDGEAHGGGGDKETSRSPDKDDLSRICAELNRLGAKYIVVGFNGKPLISQLKRSFEDVPCARGMQSRRF